MKKSALLVLDFINDIVHEKGKIARSAEYVQQHQVIENANRIIEHARKKEISVIFVKVGFSPSYYELPAHSPFFSKLKGLDALKLGAWGTEFHEKLNYGKNDIVVIKHRVSAFYATDLETILRSKQIDSLIICGVSTNMAVELTAREAHDRDYEVTIIADACGAANQQLHEQSLTILQMISRVVDVTTFLQN